MGTTRCIILAAGRGTRLSGVSGGLPKCLVDVGGQTILSRQLSALASHNVSDITVVVGYRRELVAAACPGATCVENPRYASTNTAKSLLCALERLEGDGDVLWMNGDVLFDSAVLGSVLSAGSSCVGVNREKCGAEEVKYRTNRQGAICQISKEVTEGEGEALGVNLVQGDDVEVFVDCLRECKDNDYFEKGLELAVSRGVVIHPIDLSQFRCIEVDFDVDLVSAKELFGEETVPAAGERKH